MLKLVIPTPRLNTPHANTSKIEFDLLIIAPTDLSLLNQAIQIKAANHTFTTTLLSAYLSAWQTAQLCGWQGIEQQRQPRSDTQLSLTSSSSQ